MRLVTETTAVCLQLVHETLAETVLGRVDGVPSERVDVPLRLSVLAVTVVEGFVRRRQPEALAMAQVNNYGVFCTLIFFY